MDVRIVITGCDGRPRTVYFDTTDEDMPAEDFCLPGEEVIEDWQGCCDLPETFPTDCELRVVD